MGISSSPRFLLFLICYSTCILTSASADQNSSQLATQVCKNTSDFPFCHAAIFSDPRASSADQYDLSYIAFGQAYRNATTTRDYINSSLKSMDSDADPRGLDKCLGFYNFAIRALSEVLNDLDTESFYGLDKMVLDSESSIRACETCLPAQSPISHKNQILMGLLKICYVVSQLYSYR